VAGAASLFSLTAFLLVWKPRRTWRFSGEADRPPAAVAALGGAFSTIRAWIPFIALFAVVVLWGLLKARTGIDAIAWGPFRTTYAVSVPFVDGKVYRAFPVVAAPKAEEAIYRFSWLSATGTGVLLAAVAASALLGQGPRAFGRSFLTAARRMRLPALAIAPMLGLGFVTRYGGLDAILGLAFTRTGPLYPFFGTYLGWLGVALTGSDTASNTLFGSLQKITAERLGLDPVLMASANSAGGVMGKMVDAQSIVVASAASNQTGGEGKILVAVLGHSIALAGIVAIIVLAYAYLFPGAVPHGTELLW
jgi:lactate permease